MHIVHLFQVITSLYFGKISVFTESGKISTKEQRIHERSSFRLFLPIDFPQNFTLACNSRTIILRTIRLAKGVGFTLWEDKIRRNTAAHADRWMMAHLERWTSSHETRTHRLITTVLVQRWISSLYLRVYIRTFHLAVDWSSFGPCGSNSMNKWRQWMQRRKQDVDRHHRFAKLDQANRRTPFLRTTSEVNLTVHSVSLAWPHETDLCQSLYA